MARQKVVRRNKKKSTPGLKIGREVDISDLGQAAADQSSSDTGTKSQLARTYVKGFLWTIGLSLVYSWVRCFDADQTKDIILTLSSTLSGPLGFIIGYYFKTDK